ncbi:MAG TPA: hypothetical protein VGH08_00380 [Chthoniobacterales bacterium]|jgi:hypothetical protein
MNEDVAVTEPELEPAIYFGAIVAGALSLLPYISLLFFIVYIVGALAAVWFAINKRGQFLTYKDGAKLGFLSVFYGVMGAVIVVDIIWQFFDYQLWQKQNSDFLLSILNLFASPSTLDAMKVGMAQNASKPFAWYVIIVQVIAGAICAAIFAAPSGLLGVKLFQGRAAR